MTSQVLMIKFTLVEKLDLKPIRLILLIINSLIFKQNFHFSFKSILYLNFI